MDNDLTDIEQEMIEQFLNNTVKIAVDGPQRWVPAKREFQPYRVPRIEAAFLELSGGDVSIPLIWNRIEFTRHRLLQPDSLQVFHSFGFYTPAGEHKRGIWAHLHLPLEELFAMPAGEFVSDAHVVIVGTGEMPNINEPEEPLEEFEGRVRLLFAPRIWKGLRRI